MCFMLLIFVKHLLDVTTSLYRCNLSVRGVPVYGVCDSEHGLADTP